MRRYLVAGNWKMNMGPEAGRALAAGVQDLLQGRQLKGDVLVCPPYITIPAVSEVAQGEPVLLGAQDCSDQEKGAYTGQVSVDLLKEAGVQYVIVAHSERREYIQETNEQFISKINRIHQAGLKAIFCFGEVLGERKEGRAEEVVRTQLEGVLPKLEFANAYNTVLAYEPVWAIGTGETATAEQAQEIHAFARGVVAKLMGQEVADYMRILYGGSCKPSNSRELIGLPDVDGGLIGGAALKAEDFVGIVEGAEASQV